MSFISGGKERLLNQSRTWRECAWIAVPGTGLEAGSFWSSFDCRLAGSVPWVEMWRMVAERRGRSRDSAQSQSCRTRLVGVVTVGILV